MVDLGTLLVSGSDFDEFSKALTLAIQTIPPESSARLRAIRRELFGAYGFIGAYERMNGRTVKDILTEYQPGAVKPLASGKVDEVEYRLYEAPATDREGGREDEK